MEGLPRIRDFDGPHFDSATAGSAVFGSTVDPYTPLAALRRKTPVFEGRYGEVIGNPAYGSFAAPGQREFLILGYKEVAAAASDAGAFSNGPALENSLKLTFGNTVSIMDPPVHGRFRRIFQAVFLPKAIAAWGDDIVTPVVNKVLDEMTANGPAIDLVKDFTIRYPFEVIYRQLDLPHDEAEIFHRLSVAQMMLGGGGVFYDRALEASAKLGEYFRAMVAARRRKPGKDLVSLLAHAEVDGERLSDELIISFLRQLINAGGETTFHATSSLLAALLNHPDQLAAVRADRGLVPQAIEEAVRWEPPSAVIPRHVERDIVLGGVTVPAGSWVELCFGVANRDETVFEDPDAFNVFRPKARHFGFGFGPHLCIGQHLARIEIKGALNAILDRFPNLRLDPGKPPPVVTGGNQRHPKHVHVLID